MLSLPCVCGQKWVVERAHNLATGGSTLTHAASSTESVALVTVSTSNFRNRSDPKHIQVWGV